ncbi:hypothetical protein KIN20_022149 [Parelaphostrongylus tenuis]|uniref:Protein FAM184A/B N-terminal domain-containing protein n=1 Tax=Parelaphostrongylus tenuis TaxID=148309 RepID=A0AAD5N8P0_PARTN|nr:hypothetical protein KIN20_022149 [Parelaphostrongylus tenuis]
MSERLRERLGYFTEELDSQIRSTSPTGSRSPRRSSRSPRPHNGDPVIAVAIPLVRDSRPDITAWPAPPQNVPLTCITGNVRTPTTAPACPAVSPPAASPISNGGSTKTEIDDSTTLLTMLKVAASTGTNGVPRGRETELKKKIQTLEETVAEYERQKYNVMGTFSEYRERVAERERKLEAEYSSRIIALSEEVLGAKKDFEARMKSFQALQDKFEREKEQALEKLRQEHQKEIQLLEQRFSESQLLNLEQKYVIEIQRLEEERKSLRSEKERLEETFEIKLRRAQSLYETELTAAKMLYTKELEALRDHEDALKEELLARQDEFHDRLQELQHQSQRSRDELDSCKNEVTALERKLQSKEIEVQDISKELEDARAGTDEALKRLSLMTIDYNEHRQRFQQQEDELRKKSRLLSVVESARTKLETIVRDQQTEVRALKNKVEFLKKERENLQSQSESQAQLQNSQVNALEAVLESVTKEKEATKEHYEGLLVKERQQAEAREHAMKKEFSSKLNELEEQYTSLKEDLEHSAKLDRDELRESTQHEIQTLRTEKTLLETEVSALKEKFLEESHSEDKIAEQLSVVVSETTKLTKTLEDYRQRINSKDEEIISLRQRIDHELSLSEEQVRAIKDDLRHEILASDEYQRNLLEIERLHSQIAEYERKREEDEEAEKEHMQNIERLRLDNENLKEMVKNMDKTDHNKELDSLKKKLTEKDEELRSLREDLTSLKEQNEKLNERSELTNYNNKMLREEISTRRNASTKTSEIEALYIRVKEMLDQMCDIKDELEKRNKELQEVGDGTEIKLETSSTLTNGKLKMLNITFEKKIESLKRYERELTKELHELRETDHDCLISEEEVEKLTKEIQKMDELMSRMKDDLKEKRKLLADEELIVHNKKEEISSREEALMKSALKHCEEFLAIRNRTAAMKVHDSTHEKRPDTTSSEIQTDPIRPQSPVAIADFVKENELRSRIVELEQALEIKNDLIEKLHEQMPQTSREDMVKKKDRSQSMTTGGVFQNLVSQMKDKRDEANEQRIRKKEEKRTEKAVKEAAIETIKEKSPLRSKSPSLLTRFRDRSPNKTQTPVDNLETTPSVSSRNLLSPSDAERRSSPSRPLFSRYRKEPRDAEKRPAWKF